MLADPVTLKVLFEEDASLQELDGARYLAALARAAETIVNAAEYARIVYDLALKRGLIQIGEEVVTRAYEPGRGERRASRSRPPSASCSSWPRKARSRAGSAPSRRC